MKKQTIKASIFIMFLSLTVILVIQGCGGGGGGGGAAASSSAPATGTLSGSITLPGRADPSGALVIASKMTDDGTQPASKVRPKAGGQLDPKADDSSYVTVTDANGEFIIEVTVSDGTNSDVQTITVTVTDVVGS